VRARPTSNPRLGFTSVDVVGFACVRMAPSPGITTVAVVPGGTVTLSRKRPFSIRQSLTMSPWMER